MKKIILILLAIALTFIVTIPVMATEETDPVATNQYTTGEAQAADSQTHGSFSGNEDQHEVGGFGTGYANLNYQASDPIKATGWGTAEVIIDGYSFHYDPQVDNMAGGESHSSVVSTSLGATEGSWGKETFNQGAEQSTWVSQAGDLEFGYGYNQTGIQNTGSIENNGPVSAENQSSAVGDTVVQLWSGDGTIHTKVDTNGSAFNTNANLESGFYGNGGYGGGNTLINGNTAVQGQFSGTMSTVDPNHSFVSGSGAVNLTNRYESGIGNVVRAEVNSTSSVGGGQ